MGTQVLVTGASGHIGSNLVHELVENGYTVAAFARPSSDLRALQGLDVEVRRGDILVPETIRAAMDGCELVFHAAALYRNWTADPQAMERTACHGTRNVLKAANDAGIKRVIYTSSSNTVGFHGSLAKPLDETDYNTKAFAPYVLAKIAAEKLALQLARELDLSLVVVNPTGVIGRFDYRTTPTSQTFVDAVNRTAPLAFDLNLVDVRDVARCHRLAAEKGLDGERYLAGGDNASKAQIADAIEALTGKRPSTRLPPLLLLKAVAAASGLMTRLTGKEPLISREMVQEVQHGTAIVFDTRKAREQLGLEPAGVPEVVRQGIAWAAHVGTLKDATLAARFRSEHADPDWPQA